MKPLARKRSVVLCSITFGIHDRHQIQAKTATTKSRSILYRIKWSIVFCSITFGGHGRHQIQAKKNTKSTSILYSRKWSVVFCRITFGGYGRHRIQAKTKTKKINEYSLQQKMVRCVLQHNIRRPWPTSNSSKNNNKINGYSLSRMMEVMTCHKLKRHYCLVNR